MSSTLITPGQQQGHAKQQLGRQRDLLDGGRQCTLRDNTPLNLGREFQLQGAAKIGEGGGVDDEGILAAGDIVQIPILQHPIGVVLAYGDAVDGVDAGGEQLIPYRGGIQPGILDPVT